jgi:hypothetical protein|tara:strand:+ start:89 stop:292 length:204 start_codon:yes stop_codon:yes gene_type:complete
MNLKQLVNDKPLWDNFVEYLDDAISKNHTALEQSDNHVVIHRLQGAIGALRRLKYLREEMNGVKDGS